MIEKNIYVKNYDGSIFLVTLSKNWSCLNKFNLKNNYLEYNLEMISCRDYFSEDVEIVGNCSKYHASLRNDTIIVYPFSESLQERLEEEGYTIVDSRVIERMSISFNEFSKNALIKEVACNRAESFMEEAEEKLEELCKDLFTEENIQFYKEDSEYFYNYLANKLEMETE